MVLVAHRKELTFGEMLDSAAGAPGLSTPKQLQLWLLLSTAWLRRRWGQERTTHSVLEVWDCSVFTGQMPQTELCLRCTIVQGAHLNAYTQGLHSLWWECEGQEFSQDWTMTLGQIFACNSWTWQFLTLQATQQFVCQHSRRSALQHSIVRPQ